MFGVAQLPRTLAAAERDVGHARRHVRLSVVSDLVRLAMPGAADRDQALRLLTRLLEQDPDPEVRARAAIGMADCEAGPDQVDVLITAARSEYLSVAEMALAALREVCEPGERRVTRLLENLVQSKHAAVRFQVVAAGSRLLGDSAFDKLLTGAFVDEDAKVRALAFRVCEERFDVELPEFVQGAATKALKDVDRSVRLASAILLAPLGHETARTVLVTALNQRWSMAAPEDEQTVIELAGELKLLDALPGLRRHSRGWLGLVPGRFAWQAQVAMASLGDASAQKAIAAGLRSRESHVRAASALAVGRARLHGLRGEVEALGNAGKLPADVFERVIADLASSQA
jgi:HEAT repeat protein